MNKKAQNTVGIKDSISKLFILRDSCVGTCTTQKDNPHIIWFEGAAVLLQQGVDKLKSAQHKVDSGGEDANKHFRSNVKEIVSKLIVLKRSWIVSRSEETDENVIWFEGAESIICEVVEQLQKALQETEPQAVLAETPRGSTGHEEAAPKAVVEENVSDTDAGRAEKQAAVAN